AETLVEEPVQLDADALRQREIEELRLIEDEEQRRADEERQRLDAAEQVRKAEEAKRAADRAQQRADEEQRRRIADRAGLAAAAKVQGLPAIEDEEVGGRGRRPGGRPEPRRPAPARTRNEPRRRSAKLTVTQVLSDDGTERTRSLAAMRRAREKERRADASAQQEKIIRDVVVPETITVQELANRMAERGGEVVKTLMKMGVMAT